MTKVCVIGVYFGKLPNYFPLWLRSCENNETIDFYIVTDNELYSLPANVRVIKMTLDQMKTLAEQKLNMRISLETPYKCCDYKPVYGIIFQDFITEYDFWGHCDFDLLFGDLRFFFKKYNLESYDKFLPLGHLAFYRNTKQCNERYMIEPKSGNYYKTAFTTKSITQFDELAGINAIYTENNFSFFKERVFVDVSIKWDRIKCAEDYIDPYDSLNNSKDINYRYQVFAWKNGKVLRYYVCKKKIETEEFMYIHIKKRKFKTINDQLLLSNVIFICPHSFVGASSDEDISKKLIQKLNHNYGIVYEKLEGNYLRKIKSWIRRAIASR